MLRKMEFHDEEGGRPGGKDLDLDSDLEKDVMLSDSEANDSPIVLRNGRGKALLAAVAQPSLGSHERNQHHGSRSRPSTSDTVLPPVLPTAEGVKRPDAVRWRELPRKKQLVVITLARLSEPLVQTSLQVWRPVPRAPFDYPPTNQH